MSVNKKSTWIYTIFYFLLAFSQMFDTETLHTV